MLQTLKATPWKVFAAGALFMLGLWHIYAGQPFKLIVDWSMCLIFLFTAGTGDGSDRTD